MNTTPDHYLRARQLFKETMAHKAKADTLAWQLLSHPDATPEQLVSLHRGAVNVRQMLEKVITACRHKWPDRGFKHHPWNSPEFDKYNRPSILKEATHAPDQQA